MKTLEQRILERQKRLEQLRKEIEALEARQAMSETEKNFERDIMAAARLIREIELKYSRGADEVLAQVEQALTDKVPTARRLRLIRLVHSGTSRSVPQTVFCNPNNPEQTWNGRGRRPKWLIEALEQGSNCSLNT